MKESEHSKGTKPADLDPTQSKWGSQPEDNFGYDSEEERRANRGLEDWEMVDQMSESQPGVFAWLHTVAGSVVAGIILFALAAYAIYYFTYHYGSWLLK